MISWVVAVESNGVSPLLLCYPYPDSLFQSLVLELGAVIVILSGDDDRRHLIVSYAL